MFQNKVFRVASDMLLVLLSASVGTFIWNHGPDIFNSGNILEATMSELSQYTLQYAIIFIGIVLIGILLWLRHKHDSNPITKEDMAEIMKPVVSILCKIAKKIDIQDIEIDNQSDEKLRKTEGQGENNQE